MPNHYDRDPNEALDTANFKAQEQATLMDLYGVKNTYGESDLFTKLDSDIMSAADTDTYRPFFEMTQSSLQRGFRQATNEMKSTGFASSSGEQSIMDSILADYGTKSAEPYRNMLTQAQAAQENV